MSDEKCSGCGAPASPSAMACAFCGKVLKTPKGAEEEIALLRELAQTAQRIGSEDVGEVGFTVKRRFDRERRVAAFWTNAFVPTTTQALRFALEQCSTLGTAVPFNLGANVMAFNTLVTISSRTIGLALAMANRSDASEQDRALALAVQELIEGRVKAYKKAESAASRLYWVFGGFGVFFCIVLPLFSIVQDSCNAKAQRGEATKANEPQTPAPSSLLAGFEGRYRLKLHPGSDYLFVKGNAISCAAGGCKDTKWGSATCTVSKAEVHPTLKEQLLIKEAVCVVGENPSCTDKSCRFEGCSGSIKRDADTAKLSCGDKPIFEDDWIYWKAD